MDKLIPFSYNQKQVRIIEKHGEPWFVAMDVCDILEIEKSRDAMSRLDDDERGSVIVDTLGGPQTVNAVNEPGLYALVMSSRKPEAKQFKRWITHEVIPSIRKNGQYISKPVTALEALQQTVQALTEQNQRISQLESTTQAIKDTITTTPDNWREEINRMFNRIVDKLGGNKFEELRVESYSKLESRARVNLKQRLANHRERLREQGAGKSKIDKANRLDIIEQDPKLREIYAGIIKEYTIRFVA